MTRETWYELHALRRRCTGDPGAVLHLTRDAQDARAEAVRHERATAKIPTSSRPSARPPPTPPTRRWRGRGTATAS